MKVRTLAAQLLIVLLTVTSGNTTTTAAAAAAASSAARPFVGQDIGDATKITAEEEREVREVAERFVRRMEETNDLAPLIGEMFVADYAARLHREAVNKPLFLMSKGIAEQAGVDGLARYQLALNNCWYAGGLLLLRHKLTGAKDADDDDGDEAEDGMGFFRKALPPDIVELFENDPILKRWSVEEANAEAEENTPDNQAGRFGANNEGRITRPDENDDDGPIRSVDELRAFTSTLELGATLARRHLGRSSPKPALLESLRGADDVENPGAERDRMRPRAWLLTREFYGYAKDTRIFCANVLLYHMDLVRVGGKLKVLALDADIG